MQLLDSFRARFGESSMDNTLLTLNFSFQVNSILALDFIFSIHSNKIQHLILDYSYSYFFIRQIIFKFY